MQERTTRPAPVAPAIEAGIRSLRGGGRPLAEPARQGLERATGRRLAHVRVHDDALSHELSAAVGARAFTAGAEVAVGAGGASRGLLAHELAHAAQQSATPAHGPLAPTCAGDPVEQAVER